MTQLIFLLSLSLVANGLTASPSSQDETILNSLKSDPLSPNKTLDLLEQYIQSGKSEYRQKFQDLIQINKITKCSLSYLKELLAVEQQDPTFASSIQPYIRENRKRIFNKCKDVFDNLLQDALDLLSANTQSDVERYEKFRASLDKEKSEELDFNMMNFFEQNQNSGGVTIGEFCFKTLTYLTPFADSIDAELESLCDSTMLDWIHNVNHCRSVIENEDNINNLPGQ